MAFKQEVSAANQLPTLYVIKRSGKQDVFSPDKIRCAIQKANAEETREKNKLSEEEVNHIVDIVTNDAYRAGRPLSVEEIQEKVLEDIFDTGRKSVYDLYRDYRNLHTEARNKTGLYAKIEGIVEVGVNADGSVSGSNEQVKEENSNKNPTILSVQRDYIAGELSRDYTKKYLLPPDIAKANDEGIIHFHDMDYFIGHMHNCFDRTTSFLTDKGVKSFSDFKDGDKVNVLDKDGILREATVCQYGYQKMQKVTFKTARMEREIIVTEDHRWILSDGSVTTSLAVGDHILALQDHSYFDLNEITDTYKANMFTLGFIIGDGCDHYPRKGEDGEVLVRLCNRKTKYSDVFKKAGYASYQPKDSNDIVYHKKGAVKQDFLNCKGWRFLRPEDARLLFFGYMAADGCGNGSHVVTSDVRVALMIEETCSICGYYITRKSEHIHDTNFKKNAFYIEIGFITHQSPNGLWRVEKIEPLANPYFKRSAWCVEEPVTHSFILEGGIITGNCCLVNLEDMLQNGTKISGTRIDPPKSFSTAATVASQIVAQVSSCQFGGQTISLSHLAPFVDVSRRKIRKRLKEEFESAGIVVTEDEINEVAEKEVLKEIEAGCQTIQYQLITLQTTNGQAPFVTVFMYLHEVPEGQTRDDLALLIKVMLEQRILGVKNDAGVYITPAFPKLIYVLSEDNIKPGTEYWELTKLAARCTAKRMVPDYISEKVMLELKGDVYPCMGCVGKDEVIAYKLDGRFYMDNIENAWKRITKKYKKKKQPGRKDDYYVDLTEAGVSVFDQTCGFTPCYGMIYNHESELVKVDFEDGYSITCTPDHPFTTEKRGTVRADELTEFDVVSACTDFYSGNLILKDSTMDVRFVKRTKIANGPSFDVTTESEHFTVSGLYSHNCRSFLTPDRFTDNGIGNIENRSNYKEGEHRYYGRYNQGVVTLNLVDVACSSGGDINKFWDILEERLDLCHRALRIRHERLLGTPSDVAPILWQDGALARLEPGETIDELLYHGYSTISLGYAGLAECVYHMTGHSHTEEEGKQFGLAVMQKLNDAAKSWREQEDIDYSVYGTPLETTTEKFAKCLQRRFGIIPHVTDKNYVTNSYHIHVTEEIDAFSKLSKEAEFQKLSPGGAISYVEVPNLQQNVDAVLAVMQHIYNTILYAELNTKSDFCSNCNYDGEMRIVEDGNKLIWECPFCGCRNQNKLHVARRSCGYIGTNFWTQGRTAEIKDRVLHL